MKKCLIVQPGAFGDLFVCAPIAKYYNDMGYKIIWPTTQKFSKIFKYFPYINHLTLSDEKLHEDWLRSDVLKILKIIPDINPDIIINLADRGPHPTQQMPTENFEQCKYRLSQVPFGEKHKLSWTRNAIKEESLFKNLGLHTAEEYAVVHNSDSSGAKAPVPDLDIKQINVSPIDGYEIPDWFLVFDRAKEIYCTESSIHQFIDGAVNQINSKKYLLSRPNSRPGCRLTTSFNWDLTFVGYNSIISG